MNEIAANDRAQDSARTYTFFLVVSPGLEDLAARELERWYAAPPAALLRGGLEFSAPLTVGLQLNRVLKIPARLLLRLGQFGCRDFPKLFRKVSAFPWETWIAEGCDLDFRATSHGSRLKIKRRIEETCSAGWEARRKKLGLRSDKSSKGANALSVYVRFMDDVCTLSLDTSGEILHKRGWRELSSGAPLRENLAAAMLLLLEEDRDQNSGVPLPALVDPMMGSGTFLVEAATYHQAVTTRGFAFEVLRPWLEAVAGQREVFPEGASEGPAYSGFIGFEKDEKVVRAARENIASSQSKSEFDLRNQDIFTAEPLPAGRRWVITNPPYGERIPIEGPPSVYYERLMAAVERVVAPERACFLFPEKSGNARIPRLRHPSQWRVRSHRKFLNGGLPVVAVFYERVT